MCLHFEESIGADGRSALECTVKPRYKNTRKKKHLPVAQLFCDEARSNSVGGRAWKIIVVTICAVAFVGVCKRGRQCA